MARAPREVFGEVCNWTDTGSRRFSKHSGLIVESKAEYLRNNSRSSLSGTANMNTCTYMPAIQLLFASSRLSIDKQIGTTHEIS